MFPINEIPILAKTFVSCSYFLNLQPDRVIKLCWVSVISHKCFPVYRFNSRPLKYFYKRLSIYPPMHGNYFPI